MLSKVVLTFKSVDETIVCDHSNESYWAIHSCGTVYYAVQGGSNFLICGWNPCVWPIKWKLLNSTFRCCSLWLCLIFVQKFLWKSSKTTGTKTCREKDKKQWMETKIGTTGIPQETCATTCFTRKTRSWKSETNGASKPSRSGQACSGSTGKTAFSFWARTRIGNENNECLYNNSDKSDTPYFLATSPLGQYRFRGFVILCLTEL